MGDLDGHARVQHGGAINGFAATLMRFPAEDVDVAVLINTSGDAVDVLGDQVARAALGLRQPVIADLPVTPDEGKRWAGTYETARKQRFVVAFARERLTLHPEADPTEETPLLRQTPEDFLLKGSAQHVRFGQGTLTFGDGKRVFAELQRISSD
jgi:hypothetical protein